MLTLALMKPRHCNDGLEALISLGTKETIAMSEDRQLMVINHEENAGSASDEVEVHLVLLVDAPHQQAQAGVISS